MWILTVYNLRDGLIHADGKDHLVVVFADLYLIHQPRGAGEWFFFQTFRSEVISSQRQFLVFVVLIEVVVREIAEFLGSNHLLHQFYSGVVLSAIAASFSGDGHLCQL